MNRVTTIIAASSMLGACGGGSDQQTQTPAAGQDAATQTPVAVLTPDEKYSVTGKPQGPVRIDYRVIGTPVVGQPVTIDLVVKSNVGDEPVTLSYEMHRDSRARRAPVPQRDGSHADGYRFTADDYRHPDPGRRRTAQVTGERGGDDRRKRRTPPRDARLGELITDTLASKKRAPAIGW
jgi:hypothetical protein